MCHGVNIGIWVNMVSICMETDIPEYIYIRCFRNMPANIDIFNCG